ncbi:MAG: serine/threonine-protein kinase [Pseudonocardiaceae bacterium]
MTVTRLGDYQLEEMLGRGGMGEVYRAHDLRRDRRVALKLLAEHLAYNQEYRERFRRESHIAARLQEPHVIPIHDYGEIEGRLFIDMRLVNGIDLGKVLEQTGPLAPNRTVDIVSQVAQALDAAHSDGLVHRDVKPANVLVTGSEDFVYLVDFGVAYAAGNMQLSLTATGFPIGTPNYMAPERFDDKPADRRADIYALGCLLHECLTAMSPFSGDSIPALMKAHLYNSPPKPSQLRAGIPAALDDVVARAMAKDPGDRYATAGELAVAARDALTAGAARTRPIEPDSVETDSAETVRVDGPPPIPPPPLPPPAVFSPPKSLSGRIPLALGAAVLIAGTVLTVLVTNRSRDSRTAAPASPVITAPTSLSSARTTADLFGAETRNGSCNPAELSQYRATANDIEVLECTDPSRYTTRYFYKYDGLDSNGWVDRVRSGTQHRNFTFVRADSCADTYTAIYTDTSGQLNNSALHIFRRAPFVAEVVMPESVANLDAVANAEFYTTDMTALC